MPRVDSLNRGIRLQRFVMFRQARETFPEGEDDLHLAPSQCVGGAFAFHYLFRRLTISFPEIVGPSVAIPLTSAVACLRNAAADIALPAAISRAA